MALLNLFNWAGGCERLEEAGSWTCTLADSTFSSEPGLFALTGATAIMAGSGRIRLFLTCGAWVAHGVLGAARSFLASSKTI